MLSRNELGRIFRWIKVNRKDILLVTGWITAVTLIITRAYLSFLAKYGGQGWYIPYAFPSFNNLDLILLLASSFVVGSILSDAPRMLYGYFLSIFLSCTIFTISVFLYRWMEGSIFFYISYGWEYLLYYIFTQVFWMMIPMGVLICLLGVLLGGIFKHWLLL